MDTKELLILCKRHFGNTDLAVSTQIAEGRRVETPRKLLLMPGLAVVAGKPSFAGGCDNPAMLCVGKFHADYVAA